jgi:hypothetical protein
MPDPSPIIVHGLSALEFNNESDVKSSIRGVKDEGWRKSFWLSSSLIP